MKKLSIALAVVGLVVTSTAGCSVNKETQRKFERSGCTMTSQFNGCDLNKSYEWNRKHGFIEDADSDRESRDRQRYDRKQHHGKRNHEQYDDGHAADGINGSFAGNYVAKFSSGERGADIHVEDSGVYINGKEVRDTNQVGDVLTFREGYATYTIRKHGRSTWEDRDAGNHGTIVRD
ncbi:hypothetical protein VPZ60_004235 [Salmonella enterica]|nr:hypothetical protein [Salmonella enterica]